MWADTVVSEGVLTACIRDLRRALGDAARQPRYIETVHRRGYRFVAEVTEFAAAVLAAPDGATVSPVPPASAPASSSPAPLGTDDPPGTVAPPAVEPDDARAPVTGPLAPRAALPSAPLAGTEHRHLTVLSCTFGDGERLTPPLDPEDSYDLMQTLRATTLAIITAHDGHVAQHVHEGVLVYFGYPQAHEDDAQRAVRSGLALLQALGQADSAGRAGARAGLAVRVGIDTGMVLVPSGAGVGVQPSVAVGSPLTRAVRLGGLARPGTVVVSEATAQLVAGYFDCKAFSDPALADQHEVRVVYEVLGASALQTRLDIGIARGLTPLVGRAAELALLRDRWTSVQEGMGQVVLLRGEAGIGKSRLIYALQAQVVDEQRQSLVCRCSPYHQHTMFYPVIALLQRALDAQSTVSGADQLATLEAFLAPFPVPLGESVPLLAGLLSLPVPEAHYPPLHDTPQRQREQTLDMLATLVVAQASAAPLVFIVEDVHWADPSTLDFLERLLRQVPTTSLLVVLTCRPTFEAPWHEHTWMTPVTLHGLTRPQIHHMITQVAGGKGFATEVTERLAEKTDGVPLFVEELTRMVLETGQFAETAARYEFVGEWAQFAIPASLHDSLMARLDRSGPAKDIAQWGALLGREFTYEVIQLVAPHDQAVLMEGLERLVELELVFQRGVARQAQYRFKHALVQEVAYQSLPRRRRQAGHQRIAHVLEAHFPQTVEAQPELLAYHYTEAGQAEAAVPYWQRAGQCALQRSAHVEAVAQLTQGLTALTSLPETTARWHQELDLQVALGAALMAVKGQGAPDIARAYARARELCQRLGDTPQLFAVLRGLMTYYLTRGQVQEAHQLGEQLFRLAQGQVDPVPRMLAHFMLGQAAFYLGKPAMAQTHHAQVLALYTAQEPQALAVRYGLDLGVGAHSWQAWALWQLGTPTQALRHSQAARTLAHEGSHAMSLAFALIWATVLHQFRRDVSAVHELAMDAITLATEQGFTQRVAHATVLHGWALALSGQGDVGRAAIRQGLTASLATGSMLLQPYGLGLLAETYETGGHPDEGLAVLAEAQAVMAVTGVQWYAAELSRLQGALLLRQAVPDAAQAEACLQQALALARQQQTKAWELRAAMSLSRLWQQQGKHAEARELLAPIYGWFTEGFDTADLQEAKALLEALGG